MPGFIHFPVFIFNNGEICREHLVVKIKAHNMMDNVLSIKFSIHIQIIYGINSHLEVGQFWQGKQSLNYIIAHSYGHTAFPYGPGHFT